MPDTTLPSITVTEPSALTTEPFLTEETPEVPASLQEEAPLEDGIEEELIIEDFTIDGICGVY
jgi:mycofactocin precursor